MRLKVYMEWLEKCVSEEVVRNRKICDSLSLLLLQWTGEKQEVLGERCLFKENFLTWIFLCNSIHDRNKRELLMMQYERGQFQCSNPWSNGGACHLDHKWKILDKNRDISLLQYEWNLNLGCHIKGHWYTWEWKGRGCLLIVAIF